MAFSSSSSSISSSTSSPLASSSSSSSCVPPLVSSSSSSSTSSSSSSSSSSSPSSFPTHPLPQQTQQETESVSSERIECIRYCESNVESSTITTTYDEDDDDDDGILNRHDFFVIHRHNNNYNSEANPKKLRKEKERKKVSSLICTRTTRTAAPEGDRDAANDVEEEEADEASDTIRRRANDECDSFINERDDSHHYNHNHNENRTKATVPPHLPMTTTDSRTASTTSTTTTMSLMKQQQDIDKCNYDDDNDDSGRCFKHWVLAFLLFGGTNIHGTRATDENTTTTLSLSSQSSSSVKKHPSCIPYECDCLSAALDKEMTEKKNESSSKDKVVADGTWIRPALLLARTTATVSRCWASTSTGAIVGYYPPSCPLPRNNHNYCFDGSLFLELLCRPLNSFCKALHDQQWNIVVRGRFDDVYRVSGLGYLSLVELEERKKDLRKQIAHYDKVFINQYGRKPYNIEYGLIGYIFDVYKAIKARIKQIQRYQNRREGHNHHHHPQQQKAGGGRRRRPKQQRHRHRRDRHNSATITDDASTLLLYSSSSSSSSTTTSCRVATTSSSTTTTKTEPPLSPIQLPPPTTKKLRLPKLPPYVQSTEFLLQEKQHLVDKIANYEAGFVVLNNRNPTSKQDKLPFHRNYRRYHDVQEILQLHGNGDKGKGNNSWGLFDFRP